MKNPRGDAEHTLAVFIDFENLALGFNNRRDRFRIEKVLERLVEKGKIVVKKAYCDWSRFGSYTGPLHEAAIELIEIPKRHATGKNSADIRLVVDAVDLAYSKDHIDTFVIVSGDSDFSPLVSKLKELGKHVIGLGLADATSELLRDNCDEFIYYEDLDRKPVAIAPPDANILDVKRKAFELLIESLIALRRENKEQLYSSMVKDTMKRKKPSFNEEYHGYRTFSELLEDAQKHGLVELEKAKNSGSYVVTRFGTEQKNAPIGPAMNQPNYVPLQPLPPQQPLALPPVPQAPLPPRQRAPSDRSGGGRGRGPVQDRGPTQNRPPIGPPPAPLPPAPPPRTNGEQAPGRAFGRDLIEDIDLDEVPSYAPRKAVVKPAEPPPPAEPKPRGRKPAEPKPAIEPKTERTVRKPVEPKPAAEPKAEKPPARPRKPAAPPPPPTPPKPAEDDFGGFGAGLDD